MLNQHVLRICTLPILAMLRRINFRHSFTRLSLALLCRREQYNVSPKTLKMAMCDLCFEVEAINLGPRRLIALRPLLVGTLLGLICNG